MKYCIQNQIFENYPDLRIGIVIGRNLNIGKDDNELERLIDENINKCQKQLEGINIIDHPNIKAWRDAYKSIGVKPKKYKPTVEALLRRILKTHTFPKINNAVEAYLAAELLNFLPIGGYDLLKISGNICLRYSLGNEKFCPLGGAEDEITDNNEVIYSDNKQVLTRRWNYRDARHVGITTTTKDIILASEAVYTTIPTSDLKNVINKIIDYEEKFCGGKYESYFLDSKTREIEFKYP